MLPEGPPPPQRPTRQETKADATDRAAREIIRDEGAARDAKTAALRAARLQQEDSDQQPEKAAPSKTGSGKTARSGKSGKSSAADKADGAR